MAGTKDQIYITKKQRDFTQIENVTLRDTDLPLAAKGLLVILISMATEQNNTILPLTTAQVAKYCKESKSTVARIMNVLIEQGFCFRDQTYQERGRFSTVKYVIYETRELYQEAMDRAKLRDGTLNLDGE